MHLISLLSPNVLRSHRCLHQRMAPSMVHGKHASSRFVQPNRDDSRNIDSEWVHDKFNDRSMRRRLSTYLPSWLTHLQTIAHRTATITTIDVILGMLPTEFRMLYIFTHLSAMAADCLPTAILVENIHYDLTEDDLWDLFERMGRVVTLKLVYDRAGRSEGLAYVTYESPRDAQKAVDEFHGANANGQPIRLKVVPEGPRGRGGRFEGGGAGAGRSLADRISRAPRARSLSPDRSRSLSPVRHSDVSKPPPDNVDRYVPGNRGRRSRSPLPRRRDGRRPGPRRERGDRAPAAARGEKVARDGRPKKTQEELDAEMEDYFGNGSKENDNGASNEAPAQAAEPAQPEGDIEMVE
ncbi:hypothetical protein CJF31_00006569 [Rutstroemia sp. NJR-2017a BVV2]|nr:hypothetical protein CJF31_00006569 [Rutstroemia sp. NJR-2017a BVV2]